MTPSEFRFFSWDVATGKALDVPKRYQEAQHHRSHVAFSPNGALVAHPAKRGQFVLVDCEHNKVMATLGVEDNDGADLASLTFSPDGRAIAALDLQGEIRLWDVAAHNWLIESGTFDVVVARSSVDPVAEVPHEIESADVVKPVAGSTALVMDDEEFTERLGRPIPTPPPIRPFHRNSTLEDLETTVAGRLLSKQVVSVVLRQATKEFPDPDAATQAMVRAALREGPLRGLVLLSGGQLRFPALDALLEAFNGNARSAAAIVRNTFRRKK